MNLFKTSALSFVASAIKILSNLIVTKVIAVQLGASGLGLIGQFQNFTQLAFSLSQGGINTGVTKYTAEYGVRDPRFRLVATTALRIVIFCSIFTGLMSILLSKSLANNLLRDESFTYVFILFGATIIMFAVNNLLLAILNGLKYINTWIQINIIQSCIMLILTLLLVSMLGIDGVLIALATNQSITFLYVIHVIRKRNYIKITDLSANFSQVEAKKLFSYSIMVLSGTITMPTSLIFIRMHITETLGDVEAGIWQALVYMSNSYLSLITMSLTTYFLPRLSEIQDKRELMKEIISGLKLVLPLMLLISTVIYMLIDVIIVILFSVEFAPLAELILYQLIGDIVKIMAFYVGYISVAKAMHKIYITKQIFVLGIYTILTYLFVSSFGVLGAIYSYIIAYCFGLLLGIFVLFIYIYDDNKIFE